MSRTHKDKPYPVRAREFGSPAPPSGLPARERVLREQHEVVFYAHERAQQLQFRAHAEQLGFTVTEREVQGFLGELRLDRYEISAMLRNRLMRDYVDLAHRRVFEHPHDMLRANADRGWSITELPRKRNVFTVLRADRVRVWKSELHEIEYDLQPGDKHAEIGCPCCKRDDRRAKFDARRADHEMRSQPSGRA